MDKPYVKSVLEKLRSNSSREIQETLLKLKNNILCHERGILLFKECGGLEYILPHIKKPNERTLDISLSILGTLCLNEQNSLDVAKSNIFGHLVAIINTVHRDSLLGRTSRLIGNLSQIESNAESFHSYGAVQALVTLINKRDKNTSYPTLIMAVRALRLLWMVQNKRQEMLSLNAVCCVTALLEAECQSMGLIKPIDPKNIVETTTIPKKSQEELINGILKCMGYFTTYSTECCADQIGTRGFDCLVSLMKTHDTALKCLINLCYVGSSRAFLGSSGLVEGLVHILKRESVGHQYPPAAVKALTQLCRNSANRARLRLCNGLPVLLKAAWNDTHAFRALMLFSYDEQSFQILVEEGLVNMVQDKLRCYISTMEYEHSCNDSEVGEDESVVDNVNSKAKENTEELDTALKQSVSKKVCKRKSKVRSNSLITDAINYESEISNRLKLLKRTLSCSYAGNEDTSGGVSESDKESSDSCSDSEPLDHSANTIKSKKTPTYLMDGYSSGFGSEYGGSTASSSKRARWDWSPESGVSSGDYYSASPDRYAPWSPTSSGPTSPISVNEVSDESDSELSGRYSPVCGEPDEDDNVPTPAEPQIPDACTEAVLMYEESDNEPLPTEVTEEVTRDVKVDSNSNIVYIVNLLFRVAFAKGDTEEESVRQSKSTIKYLSDKMCLYGLLEYMKKTKRPIRKVVKTLLKVFGHSLCLMNVLRHKLPLKLYHMSVYTKHPTDKCAQCKRVVLYTNKMLFMMNANAESRYGIGQISHTLLKGTEDEKKSLATTLPYIVKGQKHLKIYFMDCNALNLLCNIISESPEELGTCVTGLHLIAKCVNIKDPKYLELKYEKHVIVDDDLLSDNLPENDIVTFLLDDLSTVNTSKSFLCQNSEVFNAMLMGQFRESSEKCIQLKNVTQSALKYLITLLQFGLHECTSDIKIFPIAQDLETSLEVLLLVDRFLFDKLKDLLRSAILQFQLTPETADKIYIWSLEEGMGFLCVEVVAYILTGKMKDRERLRLFENILELKYKNQWLEDIKVMIIRQLNK